VLNAKKMNRVLTTYLILFSVLAFSQDSIKIKADSLTKEKNPILSDITKRKQPKANDTTILNFDKNELIIPTNQNSLTKVIMVKEKSKVDWLKYLLPLFTLFLGIWVKGFLEKRSNKNKIKKSGERWIAELRSLKEPLEQQIESLEKFQSENDTDEFEIPNLGLYSAVNGEVFKSLDKGELIKFIELKNKKLDFKQIIKVSNRTNGYISILEKLYKTINEKFDKYLARISKYTSEFNANIQAFNIAFTDYGVTLEREIGGDPINDPRYRPLADLYSKYIMPRLVDGKLNPYHLDKHFFHPILQVLSHYRLEPQTKPLLNTITSCLNSIKAIRLEKHYITENIKVLIALYQKQLDELDKITSELEKH
jgi:hypothetical protein